MVTKRITLRNVEEAINLFGYLDSNIQKIEKDCSVQVFIKHAHGPGASWPSLSVRGSPGRVEKALRMIENMRASLGRKPEQTNSGQGKMEAKRYFSENKKFENQALDGNKTDSGNGEAIYITSFNNRIMPRTANQSRYVNLINESDMVISIGPAGTGKTYLAVACALADLKKGRISKIVLTRPVVETGEKLGFLPGDFYEKVNPYLRPLYDAFYFMLGPEKFRLFRDDETIEIVPLAYMRGRTMNDAFVILDEAQNTTPEQMKMFLTRMGHNSKMVITGDITQIDLEDKKKSGLVIAMDIFKDVEEIKIIGFTQEDVIRHSLVKKIIKAYEDWENGRW